MGAAIRPVSQSDALEAEFQAWKRKTPTSGATPAPALDADPHEAEFEAWKAKQSSGPKRDAGGDVDLRDPSQRTEEQPAHRSWLDRGSDFVTGATAGAGEFVTDMGADLARLGSYAGEKLGADKNNVLARTANRLDSHGELLEELRRAATDDSTSGAVGEGTAKVLGSVAAFAVPASRGAKVAGALAKARKAGGILKLAAQVAGGTAAAAPLTAAQATTRRGSTTGTLADLTGTLAAGDDESLMGRASRALNAAASSTGGRIASDITLDAALGGAAEGVAAGGRRLARGISPLLDRAAGVLRRGGDEVPDEAVNSAIAGAARERPKLLGAGSYEMPAPRSAATDAADASATQDAFLQESRLDAGTRSEVDRRFARWVKANPEEALSMEHAQHEAIRAQILDQVRSPRAAQLSGTTLYSNPMADPAVLRSALTDPLVTGATGAAVGAGADDENRLRGATIGGMLGVATGALARSGLRRGAARGAKRFTPELVGAEEAAARGASVPPGEKPPRPSAPPEPPKGGAAASPPAGVGARGPVDPNDYANIASFALDPSGERRLGQQIQQVVEQHGLDPKKRVTWEQTKRIAAQMGLGDVDGLIAKGDVRRLSGPEMLAVRNVVSSNVEQLERAYAQVGKLTPDAPERAMLERTITALEGQNDALLSRFVKARSQTGRDLNNLKILATRPLEPAAWYMKAKQLLGDKPMTDGIRAQIDAYIANSDRAGLVQYLASLRTATVGSQLLTLRKAGLLTGFKTQFRNVLGNTTMAALEAAKDAPATMADALLGAFSGIRTKDFAVRGAAEASWEGAKQGVREMKLMMRGAVLDEGLRKMEIPHEVNIDLPHVPEKVNAVLDGYQKFIFRMTGASDRPFYQAALKRSLAEQARVVAKAEGRTGAALGARVKEYLAGPTDEMVTRAIVDAEHATFKNKSVMGELAGGAKRAVSKFSPTAGAVADFVMPFAQTPGAIAGKVVEYTPLGALATPGDLVKLYRASDAKGDAVAMRELQKRAADRFGRYTTGSLALLVGYDLARRGLASGGSPTGSGRDEWALEGKVPDAVKLGDRWWQLTGVSPLGNLVAFGAQLYHTWDNPELDSTGARVAASAAGLGKTITEQPFLRGVKGVNDALGDPMRMGSRLADDQAGSVVPTLLSHAAQSIDPMVRETDGIAETLQAKIPGASRSLPAKLDQFGDEIVREGSAATNVARSTLDPFNSRSDQTQRDPLVAELQRVGAVVPRLKRAKGETRAAYRARQADEGEQLRAALEELTDSDEYRDLSHVAQSDDEQLRTGEFWKLNGDRKPLRRSEAKESQRHMIEMEVRRLRAAASRDRRADREDMP